MLSSAQNVVNKLSSNYAKNSTTAIIFIEIIFQHTFSIFKQLSFTE